MPGKKEQEEKIRELEQKIKRLEEDQERRRRSGVAGGVLRGLGDVIPGLRKMMEGLEDSEAFHERLEAINKEVDKRLSETPLKRTDEGRTPLPKRGSIPGRSPLRSERGISLGLGSLRVERDFSTGTLAEEKPAFEVKGRKSRSTRERLQHATEKEVMVDIFDEDEHLKVIAELPGVEEKDIKVELKGNKLTISAATPYRQYYKEVSLPCAVKGKPEASYKNGILEIALEKEG